MPSEHIFAYVLKDEVARTMNKEQYRAAMRWLRLCRRMIEPEIKAMHAKSVHEVVTTGETMIFIPSKKTLHGIPSECLEIKEINHE